MLFGDVGGFHDFLFLIMIAISRPISDQLLFKSILRAVFVVNDGSEGQIKDAQSIQISDCRSVKAMLKASCKKSSSKRLLKSAKQKLDSQLDIVRYINES